MFGCKSSSRIAPRQHTRLYALVKAMKESGREWSYQEMSKFGFEQTHVRPYDPNADRGYWSVNIRFAKKSLYIKKTESGKYVPTETCACFID